MTDNRQKYYEMNDDQLRRAVAERLGYHIDENDTDRWLSTPEGESIQEFPMSYGNEDIWKMSFCLVDMPDWVSSVDAALELFPYNLLEKAGLNLETEIGSNAIEPFVAVTLRGNRNHEGIYEACQSTLNIDKPIRCQLARLLCIMWLTYRDAVGESLPNNENEV